MTSHSRSYGEELQCSIFVQIASAIGDLESAIGISTRDIVDTFKELYDADVSESVVSKVTDAVMERVIEWQSRPLDAIYPIVYLDCIVVKIRQDKQVINKAMYLALGVNPDGQKELLGM